MRPNTCRSEDPLPAGFRFGLILGSRIHDTETRIAHLMGEFPLPMIDAPADRIHLLCDSGLHGFLQFQFDSRTLLALSNELDRAWFPLAVCHDCAG